MIIPCIPTWREYEKATDILLKDKLVESLSTKSFLTIGSPAIYRKEHRVSHIFDKTGINLGNDTSDVSVDINVSKEIEKRCAAYVLPDRSKAQINLLQRYLPTQCKY